LGGGQPVCDAGGDDRIWPLLIYYFGIFSVVSPLASLLVLPALPFLLGSGTLAAVLGFSCYRSGRLWDGWPG